ncbi:MAG: hypothetical protein QXZ48_09020 [Zestosphaera sp.]
MSIQDFLITYLVLSLVNSAIIFLVFYYLFQKLVASKTPEERNVISDYIVMGGFPYDEPPRQSIAGMVRDIFRRALGTTKVRGWYWVFTGVGRWYALGLLVLLMLIIASLMYGW